jgi:hypothetical protein
MFDKIITIITIRILTYHDKMYWGLFTEYNGDARNHIMQLGYAGKQIPFAFDKAIRSNGDILFWIDDKFNSEKDSDTDPTDKELRDFVEATPLPLSWLKTLSDNDMLKRVLMPVERFACGTYGFSEKKLLADARGEYSFPGECANEWTHLLRYLKEVGYTKIHAYIPKMCANGICLASPIAKENGLITEPLVINFTDHKGDIALQQTF